MKKICIVLFLWVITAGHSSAQKTEPIVVASAEGATKEEAIRMALRSVIEQTFGVYVASNTSILNDEIAKDEVATISSGNIKEYTEVSSNYINGRFFVTIQASVCLDNLLEYSREQAAQKGVTIQINGEKLNNDFQLAKLNYELNQKAEYLAISNMIKQLEELTKSVPLLDYELELSEPQKTEYCPSGTDVHRARLGLGKLYLSENRVLEELEKYEDYWNLSGRLTAKFNQNTALFFDIFRNTMEAVSVTEHEAQEASKYGFKLYSTPVMFYNRDRGLHSCTLRNPMDAYKYAQYGLDLLFVQRVKITDDKANVFSGYISTDTDYYTFPYGYRKVPSFGLLPSSRTIIFVGEKKGKRNKGSKNHIIGNEYWQRKYYMLGDPIIHLINYYPFFQPFNPNVFSIHIPQDEIGNLNSFSYSYQYPTQDDLDIYNQLFPILYYDSTNRGRLFPIYF